MFGKRGMDVLTMREMKMKGKGEVAFGEVTSRVSGVERRVREGVALLLSEWMVNTVVEWKEVSSRLMWGTIRMGRECWAFISAYGPAVREVRISEMNFGMRTRCVDGLSTRNYVVVLGDLNSREVDGEIEGAVGKYGVPGENESGERLLDMCVEQELVIGNNVFKNGFRRGRGCTDQIFIGRQICKKYLERGKDVYFVFLDLEKAYDRVDRGAMWNVLRLYGIGGRLLLGVKNLYVGSKACVRVGNEMSEWFPVRVALRQECLMSLWLFNVYIDGVVREVNARVLG